MAETDKKLQDAAAAAQLGENQSSSCSFHLGLSETCENAIKHQKKKIKKRNEEDGFAWKGRNIQQLAAFWKSPSGDGGEHTVAHRVSGHMALGFEMCPAACRECWSCAGADNPADG